MISEQEKINFLGNLYRKINKLDDFELKWPAFFDFFGGGNKMRANCFIDDECKNYYYFRFQDRVKEFKTYMSCKMYLFC